MEKYVRNVKGATEEIIELLGAISGILGAIITIIHLVKSHKDEEEAD